MIFLNDKDITDFLSNFNYDLRLKKNSNYSRWIDQKCTPDVITIISDCILNLGINFENYFTSNDVWKSEYAVENVINIFKKPNPNESAAKNEYDKFFQQPLELLSYSGILEKKKDGNRNLYKLLNEDILSYLSIREKNSLNFLAKYIEKVLRDSNVFDYFKSFFEIPTQSTYKKLKDYFAEFIIDHTKINKKLEVYRIFTKILNPLSYSMNTYGTERGRISKNIITYDMLMYNRDNFRDLQGKKPKNVTRKGFEKTQKVMNINTQLIRYQSNKAKKLVKEFNEKFNNSASEVYQKDHSSDIATHMHHIFPENEFPEISGYPENIIALTPTQHLNYAHVNSNTQIIDESFQHISLLAKNDTIKFCVENSMDVYDFVNFIYVLSRGFNDKNIMDRVKPNYIETNILINSYYS